MGMGLQWEIPECWGGGQPLPWHRPAADPFKGPKPQQPASICSRPTIALWHPSTGMQMEGRWQGAETPGLG